LKRPWSGLLFLSTFGCLGVGARRSIVFAGELLHIVTGFVIDGLYLRAIYKLNKQNMLKQQLRPYLDQRFGR
jgi:hypothetical protein